MGHLSDGFKMPTKAVKNVKIMSLTSDLPVRKVRKSITLGICLNVDFGENFHLQFMQQGVNERRKYIKNKLITMLKKKYLSRTGICRD